MAKIYTLLSTTIMLFISLTANQTLGEQIPILFDNDLEDFIVQPDRFNQGAHSIAIKVQNTKTGTIYILKQIHHEDLWEQFSLIRDCVASYMGVVSGIPINTVSFIPYNQGVHIKPFAARAATLHSCAPGALVESLKQIFPPYFTLHQGETQWKRKWYSTLAEHIISDDFIKSMTIHPSLPRIAALDTFVCNDDRCSDNLFFDKETNNFCGIDLGNAFFGDKNRNSLNNLYDGKMSLGAYNDLKKLLHENYFSHIEADTIKSLGLYRDALALLYRNFPVSIILEKIELLIPFLSENSSNNEEIQYIVNACRHIVTLNYGYTMELIDLLNSILLSHSEKI